MKKSRTLALAPILCGVALWTFASESVHAPTWLQEPDSPASEVESPDPFRRVATLGASVTGGFNLEAELGEVVTLADFLVAASEIEPENVYDGADKYTFWSPFETTEPLIDAVVEFEPTLTFAVDLPFWFLHGPHTDDRRPDALEWLLPRLEALPGTVVIGTIPMLDAEVSELMVPQSMRAPAGMVARANERLAEFALEHENVHLLPLAEMFAGLRAEEVPEVRGVDVHPDDLEELLQPDRLHPSVSGTALLALAMLEFADVALEGAITERVEWDLDALVVSIED